MQLVSYSLLELLIAVIASLFIQMIALRFDVVCTVHYVAVPWYILYSLRLPQVVAGPHNNAKPEYASCQTVPFP